MKVLEKQKVFFFYSFLLKDAKTNAFYIGHVFFRW